ncbi:MAG: Maf family protein [Bryobacteraceae bacterium]
MLILASASPRRHELLLAAGIDHVVRPSSVPEHRRPGESPGDFVRRNAEDKARAVVSSPEDIVLGADTVVCVDEEIFGKPSSDDDAARMLRRLSGRDHEVYTGICILHGAHRILDVASTRVSFLELTDEEIQEYTRSGEPRDKAGAYGIQGLASKFVRRIEGCYHNVVGLPVSLVYSHVRAYEASLACRGDYGSRVPGSRSTGPT